MPPMAAVVAAPEPEIAAKKAQARAFSFLVFFERCRVIFAKNTRKIKTAHVTFQLGKHFIYLFLQQAGEIHIRRKRALRNDLVFKAYEIAGKNER